jgi:hypothetical protein
MKKLAVYVLSFMLVGGVAYALTSEDLTNLEHIRRRAENIGLYNSSLSAEVPEADKSAIASHAAAIEAIANANMSASPTVAPPPPPTTGLRVAAAGDIATSGSGDTKTSNLVLALAPDRVLTMGDNAYPDGTSGQFNNYYHPSWGRIKNITLPSAGNHDWHTAGAAGYAAYFGRQAAHYAVTVGDWTFISIDSTRGRSSAPGFITNAAAGGPACEIVYYHHPHRSSGSHGNDSGMNATWNAAVSAGVELVLNGHDHNYERFAPVQGTRQFVVGTGGVNTRSFASVQAGSEVRLTGNANQGVLLLDLGASAYGWEFRVATGGTGTVKDSGVGSCS